MHKLSYLRIYYFIGLIIGLLSIEIRAEIDKSQIDPDESWQIVLPIRQICMGKPWSKIVWIHLHDDEETSRQVALQKLSALRQGCLIDLPHGGRREISINTPKVSYSFDPNRIFTVNGRQATVHCRRGDCAFALTQLSLAAEEMLSQYLQQSQLIVAMHNNHASGLSVLSYQQGAKMANIVRQVAINPEQNPHDFFLVTMQQAFDFLSQQGFNVVLQNNLAVSDDGSLSVWAGQKHIDYINIEAGIGHSKVQAAMLDAVWLYMLNYYLK